MDAEPMRRSRTWKFRGGHMELGERTRLMGVVNITPDSFSDGGRFLSPEAAVEHALHLELDGADMLDVGAESTRPGSEPVDDTEQLRRLLPVLRRLSGATALPISVDTTSSAVARACLDAGASIVNDISGFGHDSEMPRICAESDAGVVLMHMQGTPRTMQRSPSYDDLFGEIHVYLKGSMQIAEHAGVEADHVLVDPGIGFGKTFEHNYRLLGGLHRFADLAAGVLVGPSRKAFTGEFSRLPAAQRQFPTAAAVALAVLHGADVVRVHDVREMRQVVDILDRFRAIQNSDERGIPDSTIRS